MAESSRQTRIQMILLSLLSIAGTLALFGSVPLLANFSPITESQTTASPPTNTDIQAN